jgi:hypothetical protein
MLRPGHEREPGGAANGQVLYSRWDYTGINHIYMRQLMAMNPDGTRQRAIYGSNSWFPNSLFFFKPLPGEGNRLVSILSGYHGVPRMGWLVVLDPASQAGGRVTGSRRGSAAGGTRWCRASRTRR